jgi:DNA (cytosine-5)-methyltransferase 1
MRVLDLFSGIGGFSLGLERAGFETVAFCEIEPYAQKVLAKHWPGVPIYDDVRELTAERLAGDGIGVDVITGGFPCQDISVAGKQAGIGEGTRSGLWSEVARLISELRPRYAIMENVTALISGDNGRWFGRVLGDLAEIGYDAEWHCIPASELGAHHHRDRVWIVAHPNGSEQSGSVNRGELERIRETFSEREGTSCGASGAQDLADTAGKRQQGQRKHKQSIFAATIREGQTINALASGVNGIWRSEPDVGRVANGVPARSHRLKCLGNAVVPQVVQLIGGAIMESENASL